MADRCNTCVGPPDTPDHALDPLTRKEIEEAAKIFLEQRDPTNNAGYIFNSMVLKEPKKSDLYPLLKRGDNGLSLQRRAIVVVIVEKTGVASEVLVNITARTVEKMEPVPFGQQPILTTEDYFEFEAIAKKDPKVIKLCKERDIDPKQLVGDIWPYGYNGDADDRLFRGKRIVDLFLYFRNRKNDHFYAHPLDFLAVVDITAKKVIKIDYLPLHDGFGTSKVPPMTFPMEEDNYLPEFQLEKDPNYYRADLKPLDITQPEGPSFTFKGSEISWQKWKFRMSFDFRVGLVFHYMTFAGREVWYRVSLSEMVVPYGDPRPPYQRKNAFDMGEYGIGFNINSLTNGCDCLGCIQYFDFHYNNRKGEAMTIKNAICIHEEDAGILQKHTEYRTNVGYVVRSRRLVISCVATVANYEYAFYWYFYQDGTITHEIKPSGIISTNLVAKDTTPAGHGTIVFPRVVAHFHQHIFCVRMDPMIDGLKNSVSMVDVVPLKGEYGSKENPFENGFTTEETVFKTSKEAITDTESKKSRFWTIQNPNIKNKYSKTPVAWKLTPVPFPRLLAQSSGYIYKRAIFATHNVWVTTYSDDELYAAGTYINMSEGGEGLPVWSNRNDSIENTDVVLWHTFGLTHITRVEDFPVMPVDAASFTVKPYNFFECNPALDVPAPKKCLTGLERTRERCSECNYGERRTTSAITCEHANNFTGVVSP